MLDAMNSAATGLNGAGQVSAGKPAAGEDANLREAARQFETVFVQMVLKTMRSSEMGPDILGGGKNTAYRDMLDGEFAKSAGGPGGLGIADMLYEQLRGGPVTQSASYIPAPSGVQPAAVAASTDTVDRAATPQAFIDQHWQDAERAARSLGVSPQIVLAQAALESGWGQSPTGGNNLFGIKADASWSGGRAEHDTHEFRAGIKRQETADFRAYGSSADSFDDYATFIKTNPRYAVALEHGGNDSAYIRGLQNAGYATDPQYAAKVERIAAQLPLNVAAATGTRAD